MYEGLPICVFDLETKNSFKDISDKHGLKTERESMKKPEHRRDIGVSVMVVYNYQDGRYHIFDDHNLHDGIEMLRKSTIIVSFFGKKFDALMVEAMAKDSSVLSETHHIDIYEVVAQNIKAKHGVERFGGYALGDLAAGTFGVSKVDKGLNAIKLYREGRWAELIFYCQDDVRLLRMLFEHASISGNLMSKVNGSIAAPIPRVMPLIVRKAASRFSLGRAASSKRPARRLRK